MEYLYLLFIILCSFCIAILVKFIFGKIKEYGASRKYFTHTEKCATPEDVSGTKDHIIKVRSKNSALFKITYNEYSKYFPDKLRIDEEVIFDLGELNALKNRVGRDVVVTGKINDHLFYYYKNISIIDLKDYKIIKDNYD